MEYPVCNLWRLLVDKYRTTQPLSKFSKEYDLDYYKVRLYGTNTFNKLDMEYVYGLCNILNCNIEEMLYEDKEAYFHWRSKERTSFKEQDGVVYFVKNEDGHTKIGRTHNLKARLKTLKYDSRGNGIKLIHVIHSKDIAVLEKTLHKVFANKRVAGEWFDLSEQDLFNIKR